MDKEKILIRASSSYSIGTGHIMRCLGLAEEIRRSGFKPIFITERLNGNIADQITRRGFEVIVSVFSNIKEDLEFVKQTVRKINPAFMIIDHHNINFRYEKSLHFNTDIKILSLDGLYRKHFCHILVNPNVYANVSDCRKTVSSDCKILAGYKYFILRDSLLKGKNKPIKSQSKLRVLVTLGGADSGNITLNILKTLKDLKDSNLIVDAIAGPANKNVNCLKEFIVNRCNKDFNLYINPKSMSTIINRADFCICSGGVSIGEILFFNKSVIGVVLADNQKRTLQFLSKKRLIFKYIDIISHPEKLKGLICHVIKHRNYLKRLKPKSKNLIDGLGKKRIVKAITHFRSSFKSKKQ